MKRSAPFRTATLCLAMGSCTFLEKSPEKTLPQEKTPAKAAVAPETPAPTPLSESESLRRIRGDGIVRIGMDDTELPFCEKDPETGKTEGYEVELNELLVKILSEKIGKPLQLKIVVGDWNELPSQLIAKRFDILGNAWMPFKGENRIAWSAPYHHWNLAALVKAGSPYKAFEELKSRKVGRFDDPIHDDDHLKEAGFQKIARYDETALGEKAVLKGRIEAWVYDDTRLRYLVHSLPEGKNFRILKGPFPTFGYMYGVRQDDQDLLKLVDESVEQMKKEPGYAATLAKWFGKGETEPKP